jgi:hypothetical protein
VALAVIVLLAVVVVSYRQVVRAYPSGGGSYEVATRNHQSALRLEARLLFQRGVMVVSVPWQLESSRADEKQTAVPAGAAR